MFDRFISRKKWEEVISQANNETTTSFVKNFMISDKIDFKKFIKNAAILEQGSDPMSRLSMITEPQRVVNGATPSIYYFKEPQDRPLGFPVWFIEAYPDICLWFSQNADLLEEIEPFSSYFGKEEDFIKNGQFTPGFLREAINYYKSKINYRLECQ